MQALLRKAGVSAHYHNNPDASFENPLVDYYREKHLGFLEMLKRKYDPDDLIRHPQSVKPA